MIVQKFGGTSVADAERILAVARIVEGAAGERPLVVVSALSGVTDLLIRAVELAKRGDREGLDPVLGDLGRRHRWAVSGAIRDAAKRHDLSLEIDAQLEELRALLRSVRILGEGTLRSADALLAFGEILSSKIVAAALEGEGVRARWIDAREVLATDDRHGDAEPDLDRTGERARSILAPLLASGEVPVVGGFVGLSPEGRTTTLGRGGSDTSAAVLGAVLGAAEVQIWTDVDGILTADPRLVPGARLRRSVSFAEAAEAAHHGAKVLHPASVAPAVGRGIPVRVRNTLRPDIEGTTVLAASAEGAPPLCCIASLGGLRLERARSPRWRYDPALLPDLLRRIGPVSVAGVGPLAAAAVGASGEGTAEEGARAVVCVVGDGLGRNAALRARVGACLAELVPDLLVVGASRASATAVLPADRLAEAVRALHERFFASEGS
jgi:aspartate kinase